MRIIALAAALTLPVAALAASGNDWNPPKPTETTKTCKGKRVWDETKKRCVRPRKSSLDQQGLLDAARELAYAGRQQDAQAVLRAMADQQASMVLTYWGFTHRKLGNLKLAQAYYEQALAQDPDNILTRSYMGQGFVEQGKYGAALTQWKEIRARGGDGSWAEASLRSALETGTSHSY
ncbi:tetratricopeptide repeat protein [Leisingera daeponensis]|uniref:Tetratricopeptide repeat protein n=1 Tax=Leisingera daeponensis TaxID=405746 RepID=A0ABS7NBI7_9RHOB|nr:tetratricopeptide repeat protein [Leisingera daeponensis]MBY6138570.1 tetratricopeptide repeat protein [Leisingera daeponensis]